MARPTKQPHEKRSETLRARVTIAEMAFVQDQAAAAGVDVAEYIRRRVLGFQVAAAPRRADAALVTEINAIGVNLNQIARSLNASRSLRTDAEATLTALQAVLTKVAASYGS